MDSRAGQIDVVAAHAAVAAREELLADRRALYEFAAQLAGIEIPPPVDDMLDSPMSRAAIGRLLGAAKELAGADLVPVRAMSSVENRIAAGSASLAVASTSAASEHLRDALDMITTLASEVASEVPSAELLTSNAPDFDEAFDIVTAGVRLATAVHPLLLDDLLPHVGLLAVLRRNSSERLGSASARQFPGLVVLPRPLSPVDVAEALVHEGAHQKLFDLSIAHDLLGSAAHGCDVYRPSWAPVGVQWPVEQVLAAWHAYFCLAQFWIATPDRVRADTGSRSLLRCAAARSAELVRWLVARGRYLGRDAHVLIEAFARTAPTDRWVDSSADLWNEETSDAWIVFRPPGDGSRALLGRGGVAPQVFWLGSRTSRT